MLQRGHILIGAIMLRLHESHILVNGAAPMFSVMAGNSGKGGGPALYDGVQVVEIILGREAL